VRSSQRILSQNTHHHHTARNVTVTRKGHAFDGKSLAALGHIDRRGIPYVLVILPDGSRSHIPVAWTDWEAQGSKARSSTDHRDMMDRVARLHDLLHLRKILDAAQRRLGERVAPAEHNYANDTCALQTSPSTAGDVGTIPRSNRLGRHRRDVTGSSASDPCTSYRQDAQRRSRKGRKQ
jgi:hypothetical protein